MSDDDRSQQEREDDHRGTLFLYRLDERIAASEDERRRALENLRESLGFEHPEAGGDEHAAALGGDIRLREGFTRWDHTADLVGDLISGPVEAELPDALREALRLENASREEEATLFYETELRHFLEEAVSPELLPLPEDLQGFIDSHPGLRDFVNEEFEPDELPDALQEEPDTEPHDGPDIEP